MTESDMNTAGFTPQDLDLWQEVDGAGPLSESVMRAVGSYGIKSQAVTRELIRAVAELERNLSK